jgi:hypothetical protein
VRAPDDQDLIDTFEERAAILEFDGGTLHPYRQATIDTTMITGLPWPAVSAVVKHHLRRALRPEVAPGYAMRRSGR